MVKKIVKVCGIKTTEAAEVSIRNGASLIGTILVPNRGRTVEPDVARELSRICKETRERRHSKYVNSIDLLNYVRSLELTGPEWFEKVADIISEEGPYLVGVFRNQPIEEVKQISNDLGIDIVQLHGSENIDEFVQALDKPVIPRFVLSKPGIENALKTHEFLIPLLDSEAGGEGKVIDWNDAANFGIEMNGRYILAGGLNPENVESALKVPGCYGVDVSGGVESNGVKDHSKIESYVLNARSLNNNMIIS